MPSATKFAGIAANGTLVGTTDWVNPTNVYANDGVLASIDSGSADESNYLYCSAFGFTSGDVPAGSTIAGVTVTFRCFGSSGANAPRFFEIALIMPSGLVPPTLSTSDLADLDALPPISLQDVTYGTSSELWGETLTQAIVTDAEFGVALRVDWSFTSSTRLDSVSMTVYYAEAYTTAMFPHDFNNVRTPFVRRPFALGS